MLPFPPFLAPLPHHSSPAEAGGGGASLTELLPWAGGRRDGGPSLGQGWRDSISSSAGWSVKWTGKLCGGHQAMANSGCDPAMPFLGIQPCTFPKRQLERKAS
jgi:hypothetical protein